MAAYNTTVVLPNAAATYRSIAELSWPGFDWLMISWYELANLPPVAWALALLARDDDLSLLDMTRRHFG